MSLKSGMNLKTKLVLFFSVLLVASTQAVASPTTGTDYYSDCVDRADTINNGVVSHCSTVASDTYKQQITAYYRKIYSALKQSNPDDAKKFEQAQQAWLVYRDNHCALAGSYVGSPMYDYCPMLLNAARSAELEEMASSF